MKRAIIVTMLTIIILNLSSFAENLSFKTSEGVIQALEIKDAEVRDILRMLAEQFDLNIVVSDKVIGRISVKFSNITVSEAIDAIVTASGYAYTKKGSVIKVTTISEIEKEAPFTRVFVLNNAYAEDMKVSLEKVLTAVGSIEINKRSNALIVTDVSNTMETVAKLIEELDRETLQVLIEAKIVETSVDDDTKLGIKWTMKAAASGASRPVTFPFSHDSGGKLYPKNTTDTSTTAGTIDTGLFPSSSGFPYTDADDFTFGTLNFSEFQAVFQAIQQDVDSKILSHPRIVTLNNEEASILVGTKVPIPVYTFNDDTGTYEISGYEEEQVGISLKVTPHISPNNKIRMTLHPVVSDFSGVYVGPNDERPYIDTREATTQVQLADGETVVIGGLIKQREVDTVDKVPLLGDIPLLGLIFRHKRKELETTDLLIFVTATIVRNKSERQEQLIEIKKLFKPEKEIE
ncbi:MAG: secretin N-terminal domain-containing protein [Candidatus Kaelpia imicola]|nr:secretin N-terminal domain-containing protein [Candidatus Kaelpia imicola]